MMTHVSVTTRTDWLAAADLDQLENNLIYFKFFSGNVGLRSREKVHKITKIAQNNGIMLSIRRRWVTMLCSTS